MGEKIKLLHPDVKVMAIDISPTSEGWTNIQTGVMDFRGLSGLADNTFTHVFIIFGLPVPGDADSGQKAITETYRVLKRGGVVMVPTWAGESPISD